MTIDPTPRGKSTSRFPPRMPGRVEVSHSRGFDDYFEKPEMDLRWISNVEERYAYHRGYNFAKHYSRMMRRKNPA